MKYKILVPIYKNDLSVNEMLSLRNVTDVYGKSEIVLFSPKRLKPGNEISKYDIQKFEDNFFKDVMSYNRLMLSKEFYERFCHYDYILIHQLDAFIFKKQLKKWCEKGYDYIGAPWLKSNKLFSNIFKSKKLKKREPIFNNVGNGGFSLRKVSTFLKFFENHENVIQDHRGDDLYKIEDVFWSLIAPKYMDFNIPDYKEAVFFSIDRKPDIGMRLTNGELPFGCHGFEKSKTKKFWKKYIKGLK